MRTYVIERTIPGAGAMSDDEWRRTAAHCNNVLRDVGPA